MGNLPGKTFARVTVGARHGNQVLHGRPCSDLSVANMLLDRFRQLLHQRQPSGNPRWTPIESQGKILQAEAKAAVQLRQQPSLLDRRLSFRRTLGPVQNQRLGFVHVPNRCPYRVATETPQGTDSLVAVDNKKSVRFSRQSDDHDGHLLPPFAERCQQMPFSDWPAHPKTLVSQIKLVKLKFHGFLPWPSYNRPTTTKSGSGLARPSGEVSLDLMQNQQVGP